MEQVITTYDFVLLPVYLVIFYLIVRKKSRKYEQLGLRKTFVIAFWLRMVGAIGYACLIQYYYGYGDSFGYYNGGNVLIEMIQQDFTSVKYFFSSGKEIVAAAKVMGLKELIPESMPNDSNAFIMKICALVSVFTFNKYLIISICFGFFSFIGIWKLFYFFYQMNDRKNVRLLIFLILYFPSLWFWGSGLLKEPVCVGALGIIFYLFHKNFIEKKFFVKDLGVIILLLLIINIVKSYIAGLLLLSFSLVLIYKAFGLIKVMIFRVITVLLVTIVTIAVLINLDLSGPIKSFVETSFKQIEIFQKSYQSVQEMEEIGSKAGFNLSGLNPTVESIVANSPAVIGTCLFRPFVWESKKVIIFFASLEAMFTLLFLLYILWKTKIILFFIYILSNGLLLFCFVFSILLALVIGYTTFNFGTLVRYKIIFLPFLYFLFVNIYTLSTKKKVQIDHL